jgi:ribosomal protein S18 acetylase RimI-like enzyme
MNQNDSIRLRPVIDDDTAFIFNSWLKSYRFSHFGEKITNTIYFTEHHKILEKLMASSKVLIACNQEDPSQVYGYIVGGELDGIIVLHFIYVKHTFRNMGIGKTLLDAWGHDKEKAGVYTHHTRIADRLASKYNFVYHPYLLFDLPNLSESLDEQN